MKSSVKADAEKLFEAYSSPNRFPNLPHSHLEHLKLEARRPKKGELSEILEFYRENGPDMVYSYSLDEKKLEKLFRRNGYIIYATLHGEVIGQLVLKLEGAVGLYAVELPCTHYDYRKNYVSVYMILCAMSFAKAVLNQDVVAAIAYPPDYLSVSRPIKYQNAKSLDRYLKDWKASFLLVFEMIIKPKAGVSRTSEHTKFEYERLKYLHDIFEGIFEEELMVHNHRQFYGVHVK